MNKVYNCGNCKYGSSNYKHRICELCVSDGNKSYIKPTYWEPVDYSTSDNYESDDVMVSHPSHYQTSYGLETIQVIEAFTECLEGIEAVYTGNVIKYICRWKKKNGLQDLKKAQWYLNNLINHVEKNSGVKVCEIDASYIYATKSSEEIQNEKKENK